MNSQHHGIWQFVCHEAIDDQGTECLWGTYQKAAIPLHMARHGKGTGHFECPHCGKQFQGELTLTAHIKNDVCRKGKNFVCDIGNCVRAYVDQAGLRQHQQEKHGAPGGAGN